MVLGQLTQDNLVPKPHLIPLSKKRLNVPDLLSVFINAPITSEEAHTGNRSDTLGNPLVLVAISLIHEAMRLDVALEIVRHEVVISVLANCGNHGAEIMRGAKCALFNLVEDFVEIRINNLGAILMCVAQVFNVFGEIAEEENVAFADLSGDFNLLLLGSDYREIRLDLRWRRRKCQ